MSGLLPDERDGGACALGRLAGGARPPRAARQRSASATLRSASRSTRSPGASRSGSKLVRRYLGWLPGARARSSCSTSRRPGQPSRRRPAPRRAPGGSQTQPRLVVIERTTWTSWKCADWIIEIRPELSHTIREDGIDKWAHRVRDSSSTATTSSSRWVRAEPARGAAEPESGVATWCAWRATAIISAICHGVAGGDHHAQQNGNFQGISKLFLRPKATPPTPRWPKLYPSPNRMVRAKEKARKKL